MPVKRDHIIVHLRKNIVIFIICVHTLFNLCTNLFIDLSLYLPLYLLVTYFFLFMFLLFFGERRKREEPEPGGLTLSL